MKKILPQIILSCIYLFFNHLSPKLTYTKIYLQFMSSALVAQSVERWSYEPEVAGSIPAKRTLFFLVKKIKSAKKLI